MAPAISIVMRSHNDDRHIGRTLESLARQRCPRSFEIVSIDDGSTDRTRGIIASYPEIRHVEPPAGPYVPGRTLNAAVKACRGEVVVFNNADAIPLDDDWLERLTSPLFAEAGLAAAYANQLPRADASYLVRKDHIRAFGDGRTAAKWRFFFSLASSAARRAELEAFPFSETVCCSEDVEWALRAVGRGRKIRYVPEARVEHSHNYSWRELGRRFYKEGGDSVQICGSPPGWFLTLGRAGMETLRDWLFLAPRPAGWRELAAAPARRFIQRCAYRRGALDAAGKRVES